MHARLLVEQIRLRHLAVLRLSIEENKVLAVGSRCSEMDWMRGKVKKWESGRMKENEYLIIKKRKCG